MCRFALKNYEFIAVLTEQPGIYISNGIIWKIIPDLEKSILLLECRNKEEQRVWWILVRLEPEQSFQTIQLEHTTWWSSGFALNYPWILLVEQTDPLAPLTSKVSVYNLESHTEQWYKMAVMPERVTHLAIELVQSEALQMTKHWVDWTQGETLDSEVVIPSFGHIQYPSHFIATDSEFETVATWISKCTNQIILHACDYWENENRIIISYYCLQNYKLANFLLLMQSDGQILNQTKIEDDCGAIGMHTFFIFGNRLAYIENKNRLVLLPLK